MEGQKEPSQAAQRPCWTSNLAPPGSLRVHRENGWLEGGSPCSHLVGPQLHPPQPLSMLRQESHDGGEGLGVAEPFPLHQLVEVGLFWGGGEQGRDPVSDAASEQARFEGGGFPGSKQNPLVTAHPLILADHIDGLGCYCVS